MARRKRDRPKHENLLELARRLWDQGNVQIQDHAEYRKHSRRINNNDIKEVIHNGWHERSKDEWNEEYRAWNYSIRGEDIDRRTLRIVISFDPFTPATNDADLLLV